MRWGMHAVLIALIVVVAAAGGAFLYVWFSAGSGEPSRPADAGPMEREDTKESKEDGEARAEEEKESPAVAYDIVDSRSEARFIIDEVLRGEPNTVVGRTQEVDGSLIVGTDPPRIRVGRLVINVRTIRTDDEVRDRTIRRLILESNRDEFEFSTFEPTAVNGVPEKLGIGDEVTFTVTGDLTVRDVTREVTLDAVLDFASADEVTGTLGTDIRWDDFDITIPYVGGDSIVARVDEELSLELEFTAEAVTDES